MSSKVQISSMEFQHYVSFNLSSSPDFPKAIQGVSGENKIEHLAPKKEEDNESVTWKMEIPGSGCDQVQIYYEKNTKGLLVSGITGGKVTHGGLLSTSKGFELDQIKLVRVQRGEITATGIRLAKVVTVKVGKGKVLKKKRECLPFWSCGLK